jgi:hypothetical protein
MNLGRNEFGNGFWTILCFGRILWLGFILVDYWLCVLWVLIWLFLAQMTLFWSMYPWPWPIAYQASFVDFGWKWFVISMCVFRLGYDLDVVSCDVLIVRCFETKIVVLDLWFPVLVFWLLEVATMCGLKCFVVNRMCKYYCFGIWNLDSAIHQFWWFLGISLL